MKLTYKIDNFIYNTDKTCLDLEIKEEQLNNLTIITVKAKTDLELIDAKIDIKVNFKKSDNLFFNGYQSWTDSYELNKNSGEKNILKPLIRKKVIQKYALDKYGDSNFYKYSKRKLHGYDLFYAKSNDEYFIYNLNNKYAYLIFEYNKKNKLTLKSDILGKTLKEGESYQVFSFKSFDSIEVGYKSFIQEFSVDNPKIFGYTSWYNTYQNINEDLINECLDALDSRFNLFQIDDGYETYVGDWLNIDKNKFKDGLLRVVDKIHSKGLMAGIWLAPFAAEEKSVLFNTHKDWFLKDELGNCIKAGCNWNGFYALDLTKDEVKEYIKNCLTYYSQIGFDFFKLDFVYAASIVVPKGYTRSSWQQYTYSFLRSCLPNKLILGCGANLFNSYLNFDYLRVGCDVSLDFDDKLYMRLLHRERNSTKNTVQNTIYRSIFDKHLFLNDSDVFVLRDDNTTLSIKQRDALLKINSIFSSVLMTSDNISKYDESKNELLNNALKLFNNVSNIKYNKHGNKIDIVYTYNNKEYKILYDTRKGIIYDR